MIEFQLIKKNISGSWESVRPPIILQYSRKGKTGITRVKRNLDNEKRDHSGTQGS